MRTIIAGSRTITDYQVVLSAIDAADHLMNIRPTKILSGGARGVDELGERAASYAGWPVEKYKADWKKNGKRAGYLRNVEMADNAFALIAVWDGQSKGTNHMINIAKEKGLKVYVHHVSYVDRHIDREAVDRHKKRLLEDQE